jgi:hypothetical protein
MKQGVNNSTNDETGPDQDGFLAALVRAGVSGRGDAAPESAEQAAVPAGDEEVTSPTPEPEPPEQQIQDAGGGVPGATAPTEHAEPGAEGGTGEGVSKPETTEKTPPPVKTDLLSNLPELREANQAREQLRQLEGQEQFYEAFLAWAKANPDGGHCVVHGQDIGEFTAEQVSEAVDGVRRKLTGVEVEKRLAARRAEEANARAMNHVAALARSIAPGLYINGHPQQQLAAALVQSIPARTRQQMEGDPVANLVLALAVRGASTLANAQGRKPAPTRSVAPTGAAASNDSAGASRSKVDKELVKRLIEGRGNTQVLAALLR